MQNNVNLIFAVVVFFCSFTDSIAASASDLEAGGHVAQARDNWLSAFKAKDTKAVLSYYASDAVFLQPTGDRIAGIEAIGALYQKVVSTFDTDLVLRSRNLEVSANLAFDSGEYEETLTNKATAQKQRFRGQYVMVFRRGDDGNWRIIQHVWTVAPNPT